MKTLFHLHQEFFHKNEVLGSIGVAITDDNGDEIRRGGALQKQHIAVNLMDNTGKAIKTADIQCCFFDEDGEYGNVFDLDNGTLTFTRSDEVMNDYANGNTMRMLTHADAILAFKKERCDTKFGTKKYGSYKYTFMGVYAGFNTTDKHVKLTMISDDFKVPNNCIN